MQKLYSLPGGSITGTYNRFAPSAPEV